MVPSTINLLGSCPRPYIQIKHRTLFGQEKNKGSLVYLAHCFVSNVNNNSKIKF